MEWEKGWVAGLETAILAVHRIARDPESMEEIERVLYEQIEKSMKRQLEFLDEMEEKQNENEERIHRNNT